MLPRFLNVLRRTIELGSIQLHGYRKLTNRQDLKEIVKKTKGFEISSIQIQIELKSIRARS